MGVSGVYVSNGTGYYGSTLNTFSVTTTVPNASNFWINGFKWFRASSSNYPRMAQLYASNGSTYWMIFGTFYFPSGAPGTLTGDSNLTYYYEYM